MKIFSTNFGGSGRGLNLVSAFDAELTQPTTPTLPAPDAGSNPLDTLPRAELINEPDRLGFSVTEQDTATPVDTALLAVGDASGLDSNNDADVTSNQGALGTGYFNGLLSTSEISTLSFGYSIPVSTSASPAPTTPLNPFSSLSLL